jgi:hypothetical protein
LASSRFPCCVCCEETRSIYWQWHTLTVEENQTSDKKKKES